MQDNIAKIYKDLKEARVGCYKIDDTLKRKQLSVNYDKSKYILLGSRKFRKEAIKTLKKDPMMIGNAEKEKYLGDWIHEKGCRESISSTIKDRIQKLISKGEELI